MCRERAAGGLGETAASARATPTSTCGTPNDYRALFSLLGADNPGNGNLLLDSPGFPHASTSLPNGKTVTINAPGASPTSWGSAPQDAPPS